MTFKKISTENWKASKGNKTFYIDKEINGIYSIYFLTILENENIILQDSDFLKLNEAKKYAKQY